MNKLAIFVEGHTEMLFVEKLLIEAARADQLEIHVLCATGGSSCPFRISTIRSRTSPEATHYIQIVNCTSDGNVKAYIKERYDTLVQANFQFIIGLRDVYPRNSSEIGILRQNLAYQIRTAPIEVIFILGVMEIEAWFIAEHTHFNRLDSRLDTNAIVSVIGVNPAEADIQQLINPARDLHRIYQIAGLVYNKKQQTALRTIDRLDYTEIFCNLINRFPDLNRFISTLNRFLALPPTA